MMQNFKFVVSLLLVGFFCMSCAGPSEIGIKKDTIYDKPMPRVEYEYELGPGDVIEIIYHYTPKPTTREYYLSVGDILRVEFAYHSDINRQLTVRPDGNIAMPRKGDVFVLGMTPAQLQEELTTLYSDIFKDPVITITMVQYNRAIDHLKRAITTAPRGQSKLTTVRPDGYISFPVLNDILARGRTLPELRKIVTEEYRKLIDNLTVSLILKVMKANLVYVMGEVRQPNYYLMEGPHSVSQIIARAGGVLDSAEKRTVLVISRDKDRKPWGRLVNLKKILHSGDISQDILLQQYDIVYVPKTSIARRNLFVEQYINRMVPDFFSADYFIGGTLVDHEPIIK
ncbi:MAG: polysaccharide biosynthesis/export family protein [Thermodesulfobacteriota bacterium]|nr:polysaccharide biosynthesis/export family protein [Thermodesulfobacteriota bacterium]